MLINRATGDLVMMLYQMVNYLITLQVVQVHIFHYLQATEADFIVTADGNVGIGVTSPAQTLEIHNSDASDYTDFGLKGTGHKYVIGVGNDSVANVNDKLYFYDNDNAAFNY